MAAFLTKWLPLMVYLRNWNPVWESKSCCVPEEGWYCCSAWAGQPAHELSDKKICRECLRATKHQRFLLLFRAAYFSYDFWALRSLVLGPVVFSYLQIEVLGGQLVLRFLKSTLLPWFLAAKSIPQCSCRAALQRYPLYWKKNSIVLPFFSALSSVHARGSTVAKSALQLWLSTFQWRQHFSLFHLSPENIYSCKLTIYFSYVMACLENCSLLNAVCKSLHPLGCFSVCIWRVSDPLQL